MKDKLVKTIISEIQTRYNNNPDKQLLELIKLQKFVQNSDYFKGIRRNMYRLIINAKKFIKNKNR